MAKQALPAVLVVEDDDVLRTHALERLEAAGFPTLHASNAQDAIKLLQQDPDCVDILFTDVEMPGSMDGLALAHYVRHRWPATAIVVTSGQLRLVPELLPAGAAFLSKPYSSDDLARLLHKLATPAPPPPAPSTTDA